MLSLRVHAHSEVGRVRKNNQDAGYASPTLLLVADGMGGAAAGDLASAVAATEAAKADARAADGEEIGGKNIELSAKDGAQWDADQCLSIENSGFEFLKSIERIAPISPIPTIRMTSIFYIHSLC